MPSMRSVRFDRSHNDAVYSTSPLGINTVPPSRRSPHAAIAARSFDVALLPFGAVTTLHYVQGLRPRHGDGDRLPRRVIKVLGRAFI